MKGSYNLVVMLLVMMILLLLIGKVWRQSCERVGGVIEDHWPFTCIARP